MNKKGFTLVELLVTITLITLVSGLIIPNMIGIVNSAKEDTYKSQINDIKSASLDWLNLHTDKAPDDGDEIVITLADLKKEGLIDLKLVNSKTNKKFSDDLLIYIKNDGKFTVWVDEKSGTNQDVLLYKNTIVLKGSYRDTVEVNAEYTDPGVTAYDEFGAVIPDDEITTTVRKDLETVSELDTSVLATYEIVYKVVVEGEDITKTREVKVKDTTAPVITVPLNTVISTTETSFDASYNVFVQDNSGLPQNVEISGNVTLGVPGDYIITYTAEDSSGNKTTKRRQVKVTDELIN